MASEADPALWKQFIDWMWAPIGALVGVAWNMLHKRIDSVEARVDDLNDQQTSEMNRQRDNIAKLFDKLEQHSQRAEDRHRELLTALHVGLAGKADK